MDCKNHHFEKIHESFLRSKPYTDLRDILISQIRASKIEGKPNVFIANKSDKPVVCAEFHAKKWGAVYYPEELPDFDRSVSVNVRIANYRDVISDYCIHWIESNYPMKHDVKFYRNSHNCVTDFQLDQSYYLLNGNYGTKLDPLRTVVMSKLNNDECVKLAFHTKIEETKKYIWRYINTDKFKTMTYEKICKEAANEFKALIKKYGAVPDSVYVNMLNETRVEDVMES